VKIFGIVVEEQRLTMAIRMARANGYQNALAESIVFMMACIYDGIQESHVKG